MGIVSVIKPIQFIQCKTQLEEEAILQKPDCHCISFSFMLFDDVAKAQKYVFGVKLRAGNQGLFRKILKRLLVLKKKCQEIVINKVAIDDT